MASKNGGSKAQKPNQAHHRHSLHIPHKLIKHNSGTLARLDMINGNLLDEVKLPNKRRSPVGGCLSVLCIIALVYFGAQTFYNTNFAPVIETEIAATYSSRANFEVECQVEKCYIYVEWGPEFWDKDTDICNENVLSTNWYIRDIVKGVKVDPDLNSATKLEPSDYIEEQWSSGGSRKLDTDTDCSGQGMTWGPGIAPPPEGCETGNGGGGGNGGNGGNNNGGSDAPEGASPPPPASGASA